VTYFCPSCFQKVSKGIKICPFCATNISRWEENTTYEEQLVHALLHPISEVRMGAIISLGNKKYQEAAIPLAECALEYPSDIVQNLEILRSIGSLLDSGPKRSAIKLLQSHPSSIIRQQITSP
jgi:hypothetical protein